MTTSKYFFHSITTRLFVPRWLRFGFLVAMVAVGGLALAADSPCERISLNDNWRFTKGDPINCPVSLLYDVREEKTTRRLAEAEADGNASPNSSATSKDSPHPATVIKPWILPTGNAFIKAPSCKHARPEGNPGSSWRRTATGFAPTEATYLSSQ